MRELIIFVHGMANFSHNRTKRDIGEKEAQERLIREQLAPHHNFLGAFDDSGNFAFLTEHDPAQLKAEVLAALSIEYEVKGSVVVKRYRAEQVFGDVARLCGQIYGEQFQARKYLVLKDCYRWRLGMVFVQELYDKRISYIKELINCHDARIEILSLQDGFIGLLKYDPKTPRTPWGVPAQTVENILACLGANGLATGRSARTIRGVLRKFSH